MHRFGIALIALTAGPLPALAEDYVTERGHLMCTTAQALRDAQQAVSNHDKVWLDSIKECSQSQGGLKAEIMQGGALTAKIKVYDDRGQSTIYWTSPTTLKEGRR
jgi:hypothetical protein